MGALCGSGDSSLADPKRKQQLWPVETVSLINTKWCRDAFGERKLVQIGHFISIEMSDIIFVYLDMIDYPRGNFSYDDIHWSEINCVVVSTDGSRLYTGADDDMLAVWDLTKKDSSDALITKWMAHPVKVECLAYSHRLLASGGGGSPNLCVWNSLNHKLVRSFVGHKSLVSSVTFHNKGKFLISGSMDKTVRVWSVMNGDCLSVLNEHNSKVISFISRKDTLLSGSDDGKILVWKTTLVSSDDTNNEDEKLEIEQSDSSLEHSEKKMKDMSLDINTNKSSFFVSCGREKTIVRSWPDKEIVNDYGKYATSVCFHPKIPHFLAVGTQRPYTVELINVSNGEKIQGLNSHIEPINAVCFTPDGSRLISISCDMSIQVTDITAHINLVPKV